MKIKRKNCLTDDKVLTEAEETNVEPAKKSEEIPTEADVAAELDKVSDVKEASVEEIADVVADAVEVATNGKEVVNDKEAKKVAATIKTAANGIDSSKWAPLNIKTGLTDALDECLETALVNQAVGNTDGSDLLVCGLPGSGKTGATMQWGRDRDVKICYINAKDDDLSAAINGFMMPSKDANGRNIVTRATSDDLALLERPRSILFLDEFNRASPKLRSVLLTLINEHKIAGYDSSKSEDEQDGYKTFNNLLFTVACINPAVSTDPGAMELFDAEKSRFVSHLDWDSDVDTAVKYLKYHINSLISKLDPNAPNYAFLYKRFSYALALGLALLTNYDFDFDDRNDLLDLFNNKANMLNQRSITDGIMSFGYNKRKFLDWVDAKSTYLQKDKDMIHSILDSWTEPTITVPNVPETKEEQKPEKAGDDFASLLNGDEEETDTDLFNNNTNTTQVVDANEAKARINSIKW